MQPDRLEVLARHRGQKGLIGHFPLPHEVLDRTTTPARARDVPPGRPRPAVRPRSADGPQMAPAHSIAEAREALPHGHHAVAEDRPNLGAENPGPGVKCGRPALRMHASSRVVFTGRTLDILI